jgi:GT2 family glycosyltransferase
VGGLDENLFAYMEDVDIALRLRGAGWTTAVALDAIGVHLGGATFGRGSAWQRRNGGFSRGYMLRRYGVLRTRAAPRALAVELLASLADMVISRDLASLRGRVSGWRRARRLPRHPFPPADAIDWELSPMRTLALRRDIQSGRAVATVQTERTGAGA